MALISAGPMICAVPLRKLVQLRRDAEADIMAIKLRMDAEADIMAGQAAQPMISCRRVIGYSRATDYPASSI